MSKLVVSKGRRIIAGLTLSLAMLGLSACGGSNSFPVYATIEGLVYSPLVLIDNVIWGGSVANLADKDADKTPAPARRQPRW